MERVLPVGGKLPLAVGQHIGIVVGEPIDFSDLLASAGQFADARCVLGRRATSHAGLTSFAGRPARPACLHACRRDLHQAVAERIGQHLRRLQAQAGALVRERELAAFLASPASRGLHRRGSGQPLSQ